MFFTRLVNIGAKPPVLNLRTASYFNNEIQDGNRSVYHVRGNGNCIFRAISKHVFVGHENIHVQVRPGGRSVYLHWVRYLGYIIKSILYYYKTDCCIHAESPGAIWRFYFWWDWFVEYLKNMSSSTSCLREARPWWSGRVELYDLATMLHGTVCLHWLC